MGLSESLAIHSALKPVRWHPILLFSEDLSFSLNLATLRPTSILPPPIAILQETGKLQEGISYFRRRCMMSAASRLHTYAYTESVPDSPHGPYLGIPNPGVMSRTMQ